MIKIAGREVEPGDKVYHSVLEAWGHVRRYDASGSAEVILQNSNGSKRTLLVRDGGYVNGKRVIYWHEPLKLDLPVDITDKLQRLLDANVDILIELQKELCDENAETAE